ncbi:MAG: hypothetical protein R3222_10915, partial [Balneolaceae bacterium]|nr:hypothetical protein [Balneolaceae bacterium]
MNKTAASLILLSIFAVSLNPGTASAQQVKSDYEIQQSFRNEYQSLNDSLTVADSSAAVDSLISQIRQLEQEYTPHESLLDKVLYPETYEQEITRLKRDAISTRERLVVIENQEEKLKDLGNTLSSYDNRLNNLDQTTDSLRRVINRAEQSEQQLSSTVRQYRRQLQQRDDLILSFVDSVIVSYEMMDFESISDLEAVKKRARFNADGDALKMIRNIINEHKALLESDSRLTTEEYLRMNVVQHDFSAMWDK